MQPSTSRKEQSKATENIIKLTNTKDRYDIQEQKSVLKRSSMKTEEREEAEKGSNETIQIVDMSGLGSKGGNR